MRRARVGGQKARARAAPRRGPGGAGGALGACGWGVTAGCVDTSRGLSTRTQRERNSVQIGWTRVAGDAKPRVDTSVDSAGLGACATRFGASFRPVPALRTELSGTAESPRHCGESAPRRRTRATGEWSGERESGGRRCAAEFTRVARPRSTGLLAIRGWLARVSCGKLGKLRPKLLREARGTIEFQTCALSLSSDSRPWLALP